MSHPAAPAADSGSYATIGQRVGAYFIDAAIGIGLYVVFFMLVLATQAAALLVLGYLVLLGYGVYVLFLTATKGYSPGKKIVGIRVVDATTLKPIGWGRAFGRGVIVGLLGALCGLPLLIAAVVASSHPKRQAWHDLAVNSVVVPEAAVGWVAPVAAAAAAEGVLQVSLPSGPPLPPAPSASVGPPMLATDSPGAVIPPPRPTGISVTGPPPPPAAPTPPTVPPATPASAAGPSMVPPPPGAPMVSPPPGMTPAPPADPPAPPPPPPPANPPAVPPPPPAPVDESTQIAARRKPAPVSWSFAPTIGIPLDLSGTTVIGRDPDTALVPDSSAWSIDDPERTVSKTHAVAGVEDGHAWIEDWNSTNGILVRRGTDEIEVETGQRTQLEEDDVVLLGDFELTVRRNA